MLHSLFLQGGGTVRFFHRTHECYIVAEGSFAGRFASIEAIESVMVKNYNERGRTSSSSIREDTKISDVSYQKRPFDEQPVSQHKMLGIHTQKVEVEVHESSDQQDSEVESALLSSIRSLKLNRAESVFSPESSYTVAVTDQAATLQKLSLGFTDGEHEHVVTDDGILNYCHFRLLLL